MKKVFAAWAVLALLCLGGIAQAVTMDTVPVGDRGNAADTRYVTPGYGSVGYTYNIGKYEVTAAQYVDFLNHKAESDPYGLYNPNMSNPTGWLGCNIQRSGTPGGYTYTVASDWANRPVNFVSFWDACRFANWLHNGGGAGDTENGAYALGGYNGTDGRTIQRNAGWKWAVTSEDEWYKAAYYRGGGSNAGYWDYPTQGNSVPSNDLVNPDPGNNATYYDGADYTIGNPYWRTEVGAHENSDSPYGTFDQGGNVWEMNEAIPYQTSSYAYRGSRGGGFYANLGDGVNMDYVLHASLRTSLDPTRELYDGGFRVVQAVPEPSSLIVLAGGLGMLLGMRRRRTK